LRSERQAREILDKANFDAQAINTATSEVRAELNRLRTEVSELAPVPKWAKDAGIPVKYYVEYQHTSAGTIPTFHPSFGFVAKIKITKYYAKITTETGTIKRTWLVKKRTKAIEVPLWMSSKSGDLAINKSGVTVDSFFGYSFPHLTMYKSC